MNLAALDRRVGAEGATNNFAQRLGAVDDTPNPLGTFTAIANTSAPFRIGASAQDSSNDYYYFAGKIDDVRVYNRALSATEVKQLYNAGR
jgi:hypothetical protein